MNFGTIMDSMTKTCVRMMYEGRDVESKTQAKRFINFVNLKGPLRKQFRVYHRLSSTHIADHASAHMFVEECLKSLKDYRFEDILAYNAILETKFKVPKMKPSDLHKDIGNLIKYTTSNDSGDPEEYVHTLNRVVENVTKIKSDTDVLSEFQDHVKHSSFKFLQPRHVIKIAVKKFNQKYKGVFSEDDRKLFSLLKSSDTKKICEYREYMLNQIDENSEKVRGIVDEEINRNLDNAISYLKENDDTESILYGYELLSELKELNN